MQEGCRSSSGLYRCAAGSAELHVGGHGSTARRTDTSSGCTGGAGATACTGAGTGQERQEEPEPVPVAAGTGAGAGQQLPFLPGFCSQFRRTSHRGKLRTAGAAAQGTGTGAGRATAGDSSTSDAPQFRQNFCEGLPLTAFRTERHRMIT